VTVATIRSLAPSYPLMLDSFAVLDLRNRERYKFK
jgi:hypothetical protein